MQTITLQGETGVSSVFIGSEFDHVYKLTGSRKLVFVTDTNVFRIYAHLFGSFPTIVTGTGEGIKTLDTVRFIYEKMIEYEVDRSWSLVAVGGGIVTDIAGFAAATFMRGINVGYVASTLLAQVDASVGGKNGVNFQGYKNLVGVFHQPRFVICDFSLLGTLPLREIETGYAEVIKHAVIGDSGLFTLLENNIDRALALVPELLEEIIFRSVSVKASIVRLDERETGVRKKLNFGHTFGHAFEKVTGIPHGQAISVGMVIASKLSEKKQLLEASVSNRIITLLRNFGLPTFIECNKQQLFEALLRDKKREGDCIHCVLLSDIGAPLLEKIPFSELQHVVDNLRIYCYE